MARQQAPRRAGPTRPAARSTSAPRRGGHNGWAANTWREFTGRVHAFSEQWQAFTGRDHAQHARRQRDRRRSATEREPGWSDPRWSDARGDFDHGLGNEEPYSEYSQAYPADSYYAEAYPAPWHDDAYPGANGGNGKAEKGKAGKGSADPSAKRRLPATIIAVLIAFSLVIGFCATQGILLGLDLVTATADAKAQVAALQKISEAGGFTEPEVLNQVQQHLQALDNDLLRLQSDIPFQGTLARNESASELMHVLRMGSLLVRAGEFGVDAGQVLMPAIKGMMSGLSDKGTTAAASSTSALTLDDLRRVTADVDTAGILVAQATQERALVSDSALRSMGLSSVVRILDKLDSITPKLPQYLTYAHYAAAAMPSLLGLTKPAHYLLVNQDSDELRPTGGFIGNYAVLTIDKGKLTSGVQLNDIYKLDCKGNYPNSCPYNPIPGKYWWLGDDRIHFGVRDSALSPDFATSAHYIEENYHLETKQTLDGVIAFTPGFIGKILDELGGLSLPGYDTKLTSANLQETIHYYHILYAYCQAFPDRALCSETTKGGKSNTSDKKSFDAALGSALLHLVASAKTQVQGKVLKVALDAISTRDLQIFFNDPQVEGLLNLLHLDNTIPDVNGDQLLIVNANVGASYANADLKVKQEDQITLNADGSATHNLTLTYAYPYVQHLYGSIYSDASAGLNMWYYQGVLLLMVPPSSQQLGHSNCQWPASQPPPEETGRRVWGCADQPIDANFYTGGVDLRCASCNRDGTHNGAPTTTRVITFSWVVPNAVKVANGQHTYNLTLVHQAGTHPEMSVTVTGPNGKALSSASSENPKLQIKDGKVTYTATAFTTDQNITLRY